jgi:hypothetical protein
MTLFVLAAFAAGERCVADSLPLCSVFTTVGRTSEDISYSVEHCRAGWKWCGNLFHSSIPATYLTLLSRGL